jgi:hypothetical protein
MAEILLAIKGRRVSRFNFSHDMEDSMVEINNNVNVKNLNVYGSHDDWETHSEVDVSQEKQAHQSSLEQFSSILVSLLGATVVGGREEGFLHQNKNQSAQGNEGGLVPSSSAISHLQSAHSFATTMRQSKFFQAARMQATGQSLEDVEAEFAESEQSADRYITNLVSLLNQQILFMNAALISLNLKSSEEDQKKNATEHLAVLKEATSFVEEILKKLAHTAAAEQLRAVLAVIVATTEGIQRFLDGQTDSLDIPDISPLFGAAGVQKGAGSVIGDTGVAVGG